MEKNSESVEASEAVKAGAAPLLWTRPSRASRGPQPAHSRDRIAEAAVKIADTDGIAAVSMRRVAAEMGTRATSLYRYVRSKEELLDLMVDLVMGETPVPQPSGDWRPDLQMIAHHMRSVIKRHPWMISISVRSTLGPNSLAATEATLKALDGHGLDADGMLIIATALSTFTRGYAAGEIAEQQAEMRSGLGREQWMLSQTQYVAMIRESGEYPLFLRIVDEARSPHDPKHEQQGFEQGLECLLDGIAVRLS
jgi:AcrR family transcriptional regulator